MTKYSVIFGEMINTEKPSKLENLNYYDNKNNKKIKDLKDFITYFNDNLCSCMLKLYNIESKFMSSDYKEYTGDNEDELTLKNVNKDSKIAIMKIKETCVCGLLSKNNELLKLSKTQLIEKLNNQSKKIDSLEKVDEWKRTKENIENFYDIIVDIDSVLKIKKGWKIEMTSAGKKKYEEFKKEDLLRIGVVGNQNKGKTFILSKLSKINLPSGTSISTKGISVKYPELEDNALRKYILLDSAGLETPIKKDDLSNLNKSNDEENNIEESNSENETQNSNDSNDEIKKKKKEIDKFREKARDILITESFLQNFIIFNSDILLLIVDILTYSEQKLINKIKFDIKNGKLNKKLFIIHNLKTYRKKEQVEKYIEETLLNSGTFTLKKYIPITSEKIEIKGNHYIETDEKDLKVFHLIFAADDSEAGSYYNNYSLNFIESQYADVFVPKHFDIIQEIKSKFADVSHNFLEKKINLSDFISNEEIKEKKLITLKNKDEEVNLKKCYIDELGFQEFKGNVFEPPYTLFKKDNILEIRIELPGNVRPSIVKPTYLEGYTYIGVKGLKNPDKELKNPNEDSIQNTRSFGEFNLRIRFKTEDYKIKEFKDFKSINGILFIRYELEEEKDEELTIELKASEEI